MSALSDWMSIGLVSLRALLRARAGDRARDAGEFAEAAELYGEALRLSPYRTGVRVQKANMLKDCGRFAEAESEYLVALSQRPSDADIRLQLGHLNKLLGRRTEAMAYYREAASLSAKPADPVAELAFLGDEAFQNLRFEAALAGGAPEKLLSISGELRQIQQRLTAVLESLPDLASQSAFPVAQYDTLRRIWEPPPPPGGQIAAASILIPIDLLSHESLNRVAAGLLEQSAGEFQATFIGAEPSRCKWARRLAAADERMAVCSDGASLGELVRGARHNLIVLPAPAAIFHRHALAWFGWAAAQTPAAGFVCDQEYRAGGPEDFVGEPVLRQAVDHEILLQMNPYGTTLAFDRTRCPVDLADSASTMAESVVLLLLELAADGAVGHIPYPLVGVGKRQDGQATELDSGVYARLVRVHLDRRGLGARADVAAFDRSVGPGARLRWRPSEPRQNIHVVIPSRDNGEDVWKMADSLRAHSANPDTIKITVMDNGSVEPATLDILSRLSAEGVDLQLCDEPFNWSRLSNLGAKRGLGDLLIFANDDMVMLTDRWDDLVRGLLERPEIGIVGAKLLYPDNTIQHAGILFGWRGRAIHDGLFEEHATAGPLGRWQLRRRVSAVTGAFLAVRKTDFDDVFGFDETRLAIAYSDLDIALKIRRKGLAVIYAPEIELTHYESKSRGLTHLRRDSAALDEAELALMRQRWPGALDADPSAHPAWKASTLPFRLLGMPTTDSAVRHLRATARPDPWEPPNPQA